MPYFRGMKRWGLVATTMILSSLLFAACGGTPPSILNPAGPVANQEAGLFWIILWVATGVFVLVEAMLIYSIVRYRERPNTPMPQQLHGNTTLEIIWTAVPSVALFIVVIFTIRTMFQINTIPDTSNRLEVTAVGHQWWWEFDYKNQNIVTADDLYVPTGTVVHVTLESNNVIHSFWVPALTGKTDVIPGHDNDKWFQADQAGVYRGECAEFCGSQHAHMDFNVHAISTDAFQTWVSGQQQAAAKNPQAAQGAKLFAQGACTGCHGIVGVNLTGFNDPKGAALIGPNLTHFGSRDLIAGGVLPNTPQNLATWLHDPQAVKPGNDMPNLGLSQSDINALVAYLESLQ